MGKYLITGLSGTGKSTLAEELTRRGLKALDTDKDLGLNKWFGIDTGQIVDYQPPVSPDWYNKHQFGWDKQEFERVLSGSQKDDIFICGSSYNDSEFYDLFDKVFFLVVDEQTLLHRLRNRAGKSFGKEPAELSEILKWHRSEEHTSELQSPDHLVCRLLLE